jgi:hypothetical protein
MDMTINNPCWKQIQAPWKKAATVDATQAQRAVA